jgi:hypothetical protein
MLSALVVTLFVAPLAAAPATTAPVSLFQSACLRGEVQLDPANVETLTFDGLPNGAREVIGRAIYRGPGAPPYPATPLRKDFPNPIYKIESKDIFLIATTPEQVPGARFADSCMVVWKGDGWDAAHNVILPNVPDRSQSAHRSGTDYVSTNDGQQVLTAALLDNWTILKSSPAATEPSPPVPFPGAKKN